MPQCFLCGVRNAKCYRNVTPYVSSASTYSVLHEMPGPYNSTKICLSCVSLLAKERTYKESASVEEGKSASKLKEQHRIEYLDMVQTYVPKRRQSAFADPSTKTVIVVHHYSSARTSTTKQESFPGRKRRKKSVDATEFVPPPVRRKGWAYVPIPMMKSRGARPRKRVWSQKIKVEKCKKEGNDDSQSSLLEPQSIDSEDSQSFPLEPQLIDLPKEEVEENIEYNNPKQIEKFLLQTKKESDIVTTIGVPQPPTEGERRSLPAHMTRIKSIHSITLRDLQDRTLMRCWRKIIPRELIDTLTKSSKQLFTLFCDGEHSDVQRNIELTVHLGHWRDSATLVYEIKDTHENAARKWIAINHNLFVFLNKMFEVYFPIMYEEYMKVELPKPRYFGAWAACAVNRCNPNGMKVHTDGNDKRNGLCWIVPFGDFEGGEQLLPSLGHEVEFEEQDLSALGSFSTDHGVNKFRRFRGSLSLFSHDNCFFPSKPKSCKK